MRGAREELGVRPYISSSRGARGPGARGQALHFTSRPRHEIKTGSKARNAKSLHFCRLFNLARSKRFELLTPWFVAKYSIQLSYERVKKA